MSKEYEIAWNLFAELRKEILESQKIRAQLIGAKITFVGTGIGIIAANPEKIGDTLLVIPAFAAVFFDLLITSYGFSVKRIGHYCRNHLERWLRKSCYLPTDFVLWQQYLSYKRTRQRFSHYGNFGLTVLAIVPAVTSLINSWRSWSSSLLLGTLLVAFICDIIASLAPGRLEKCVFAINPEPPESTGATGAPHA
jgi:hypothetical protein